MLRYVKIKPGVISARCGKKYLTDKTAVYQTTMWPGEDALDLIKRGFLIEVDKDGNDLNAIPVASKIEVLPPIDPPAPPQDGEPSDPLKDFLESGSNGGGTGAKGAKKK